jgi:hypothetical protein
MVYPTSNVVQSGGSTKITMASEAHDKGGNYNTTNGRFTAPVSGRYLMLLQLSIDSNTYGLSYMGIGVRKNGAGNPFFGGWGFKGNGGANTTTAHYAQVASTIIIELATNDYLESYIEISGSITVLGGLSGMLTRWSGQLIS